MRIAAICLVGALSASGAFAQNAPSVKDITAGVIRAATNYATGIACTESKIEARHIAALTPYKNFDDRMDAKYAVLWTGDIGCLGGSGTNGTHISIVTVGTGDSYIVDPLKSSPAINFESPVRYIEKIVGNTRDSLILEGMEYGPEDANCCPSINIRFTLKATQNGDWKLAEKRILKTKK